LFILTEENLKVVLLTNILLNPKDGCPLHLNYQNHKLNRQLSFFLWI
jgi:hypothetical protein